MTIKNKLLCHHKTKINLNKGKNMGYFFGFFTTLLEGFLDN